MGINTSYKIVLWINQ